MTLNSDAFLHFAKFWDASCCAAQFIFSFSQPFLLASSLLSGNSFSLYMCTVSRAVSATHCGICIVSLCVFACVGVCTSHNEERQRVSAGVPVSIARGSQVQWTAGVFPVVYINVQSCNICNLANSPFRYMQVCTDVHQCAINTCVCVCLREGNEI